MVTLVIPTDAASVKGPPQGQWTYADWETLPDDGNRYEIIDGALYLSTAQGDSLQAIVRRLGNVLNAPAQQQGLVFAAAAPIGVSMPGCELVQPEFVIVQAERRSIIGEGRITGVPDLLVEILSPGSEVYDREIKLEAYAKAGVPEYVIIDPAERSVRLYQLETPGRYFDPRIYGEQDTATFACVPTIPLEVGKLFADSPDTTL